MAVSVAARQSVLIEDREAGLRAVSADGLTLDSEFFASSRSE